MERHATLRQANQQLRRGGAAERWASAAPLPLLPRMASRPTLELKITANDFFEAS